MACAEVSFIYALFICEGDEENEIAFTEKDTVKHYVWWEEREGVRDRE